MHFFDDNLEDALHEALRRREPGEEFTRRVMAAVERPGRPTPAMGKREGFLSGFVAFTSILRPVWAGAIAAALLLAGGGLGYLEHQRRVEEKRQHDLAMAKEAERQALVALRITSAKLSRVFQRVRESHSEPKIRRERL